VTGAAIAVLAARRSAVAAPLFTSATSLVGSAVTPGGAGSGMGYSVAISGDTIVAGAPDDDTDKIGLKTGAVFVFVRSGTTWKEQARLVAPDAVAGIWFGCSVAIEGDTLLVGAGLEGFGTPSLPGAVYVFERTGTTWSKGTKFVPSDGASRDNFGFSIALRGNDALIGAIRDDSIAFDAGSAYVFVRDTTGWTQQAELEAPDAKSSNQYGHAVALGKDTALIGAYYDNAGAASSGAAHVFVRTGKTWSYDAKLKPKVPAKDDQFGRKLALSDDGKTALIGAHYRDEVGPDSGAAYVFERDATGWHEQTKIVPSDGVAGDYFGYSTVLSGDMAVIGAIHAGPSRSGALYVYARDGSRWVARGRIIPEAVAASDDLGNAVAISGTTLIAGASSADPKGSNTGMAWVLSMVPAGVAGAVCTEAQDCATGFCADGVCCDSDCKAPCMACTAKLRGTGVDGACGPAAADTDPGERCPQAPGFPTSCGADGMCDGLGACRAFAKADVPCGTCASAITIAGKCDGKGVCEHLPAIACAPYACNATNTDCNRQCTSHSDCSGGATCRPTLECAKPDVQSTPEPTKSQSMYGCTSSSLGGSSDGVGLIALLVAARLRRRTRIASTRG